MTFCNLNKLIFMLAIVTSISGSGRKEYLKEFKIFCKRRHKKVKIYYVGKMLFEQAERAGIKITKENVLNANPNVLHALRSAVFEVILSNLKNDQKENDLVLISFHSFFYWKKIFSRAFDKLSLGRINPDIFLSFINDSGSIKEKLDKRDQWKSEDLTIKEILLWQNVEVEVTASWADFADKPFYAIPTKQSTSTLYKLLFCPELEPVYVSMPMTHLKKKEDWNKIEKFVKKLDNYFTVFDPRTVEVGPAPIDKRGDMTIFHQTVSRDLYWLIRQSRKIIAYFPCLASSPGVINELREAYETSKDVWLIYPAEKGSPFITYFCNKLFKSDKEFFTHLEKQLKLKPRKI